MVTPRTRLSVPHDFPRLFMEDSNTNQYRAIISSIESRLRDMNLDPSKLLARGGFKSQEDIDLILKTGSDYEGRKRKHGVPVHSTYVYPADKLAHAHILDEFYSPLAFVTQALCDETPAAIVFYHKDALMRSSTEHLARAHLYEFIEPTKKLEALAGIIDISFSRIPYLFSSS